MSCRPTPFSLVRRAISCQSAIALIGFRRAFDPQAYVNTSARTSMLSRAGASGVTFPHLKEACRQPVLPSADLQQNSGSFPLEKHTSRFNIWVRIELLEYQNLVRLLLVKIVPRLCFTMQGEHVGADVVPPNCVGFDEVFHVYCTAITDG